MMTKYTNKNNDTIFLILIGISIAMGTFKNIIHYNKENQSLLNIIDLEETRNNIKKILIIQKEYISKYNYNYNFIKPQFNIKG